MLRNWEMLAAYLHAQWQEAWKTAGTDDPFSYHAGCAEICAEIAELMRDLPPEMPAEEKLTRLYAALGDHLTRPDAEQIEE